MQYGRLRIPQDVDSKFLTECVQVAGLSWLILFVEDGGLCNHWGNQKQALGLRNTLMIEERTTCSLRWEDTNAERKTRFNRENVVNLCHIFRVSRPTPMGRFATHAYLYEGVDRFATPCQPWEKETTCLWTGDLQHMHIPLWRCWYQSSLMFSGKPALI